MRAHVLLCMLAYYLQWHMRRSLFAKEVLLRLRELNPEPQKPSRQISGSVRFIRPLPWSKTRSCGASGQIEQLGGQLIEVGKEQPGPSQPGARPMPGM